MRMIAGSRDWGQERRGWRGLSWLLIGVLAACCCSAGCSGRSRASVKGQVKYDGKPIEEGSIRFLPKDAESGAGGSAKIVNGNYEIPSSAGVLAGKYGVAISATRKPTPQELATMQRRGEDEEKDEEDKTAAPAAGDYRVQYLPEKYSMGTAETAELTPGENTKDFNLAK